MSLPKRNALTAIELLVVIAIIGILMSLIIGGVMMVRGRESAATANIELNEFRSALEQFKAKYGIYPPSQITLDPKLSDPMLARIWPNLYLPEASKSLASLGISGAVKLQGDQCLVFFLGGVPSAAGVTGFSTSKANPFQTGGDREGPFFKFKMTRLVKRAGSQFFSYAEPFNSAPDASSTCYAYFCPSPIGGYAASANHCDTLKDSAGGFPQPYTDTQTPANYLNSQSYQIILAGKDLRWGTGRKWSAEKGPLDATGNGAPVSTDNLSNFANGILSGN